MFDQASYHQRDPSLWQYSPHLCCPVPDAAVKAESEWLKLRGNEAMKSNDYLEAINHYTASLELDQANVAARSNRSQAYLHVCDFERALLDVNAVLEVDPSSLKVSPRPLKDRRVSHRCRSMPIPYFTSSVPSCIGLRRYWRTASVCSTKSYID
jgi:tetratricopeptide (TPR) repeat protein